MNVNEQALEDIRSSGNICWPSSTMCWISRALRRGTSLLISKLWILCRSARTSLKLVEHTAQQKEIQLFTDFDDKVVQRFWPTNVE